MVQESPASTTAASPSSPKPSSAPSPPRASPKHVTCHTFRHSFATHILEDGVHIRELQRLLGHADVRTTMVYTHLRADRPIRSPLDALYASAPCERS